MAKREVMSKSVRILCWVLLSADRSCWWVGPGFRRIGPPLPRAVWPGRASAYRAARGLKRALGIDARPEVVRLA
jgi:hypothetical protein